jgi:SAM-dependent methyltransferase
VVGDLRRLPFPDDAFDLVAGFNAFIFATDVVGALREARRVAKPGAPVVIQVWGPPERCAVATMRRSLGPFLPPPDPGAAARPPLYRAGILEAMASEAGLRPEVAFDHAWAYHYRDEGALARSLLSPGAAVQAIHAAGESVVRTAILEAMAPYRECDGGYRLPNEWHHLIARA